MSENISIKGLTTKEELLNKSLKNMHIQTITAVISPDSNIDDFFEINVTSEITNITNIPFDDMVLNILNCSLNFNIIGIDNNNNTGIFFKYNHKATITIKTYSKLSKLNLLMLDLTFNKISSSNFNFSLVIAFDFSTFISKSISNPMKELESSNTDIDTPNLYFDKEFI